MAPAESAPDGLRLRWLGTAGFQLRWGQAEGLLDPYLSRPRDAPFAAPCDQAALSRATLLLISHGHFDHAFDALALARVTSGPICAPRVVCRRLARRGVSSARLRASETCRRIEWGGGQVRVLSSRHIRFDAGIVMRTARLAWQGGLIGELVPLLLRYPAGHNADFLLELGPHRLLFSGSGGGDFAALARERPTCYLLPFAGRSDVCDYYLRALRQLGTAQVVLHHFDVFYPSFAIEYPVELFRRRVSRELPRIELIVPDLGRWFTLPVPVGPKP